MSNIAKKIVLAYKLFEQKDFTSLYSVISSACSNFELAWETVKKLPNVRYVSTKETLPLYIMKNNNPEDNLLNISVENYSISEMYYLQAYSLIEFERYEEAAEVLDKVLEWDSVYVAAINEYAQICGKTKDLEGYKLFSTAIIIYATTIHELALGYRKLGSYCIDVENFELAYALFLYSKNFEESKITDNEIGYIKHVTGKDFDYITNEKALNMLKENNIPIQVSFNTVKGYLSLMSFAKKYNYEKEFSQLKQNLLEIIVDEGDKIRILDIINDLQK